MDFQRTLVNLDREQKAALKRRAERRHRSVSAEVRDAIGYYLSACEQSEQPEASAAVARLTAREEALLETLLGEALEDQRAIHETLDEAIAEIRSTLQRIEAMEKGGAGAWDG